MHVWECIMRPKNGDIERTCEWWRSLVEMSGGHSKNGLALNRLDGENSVLIIRHTFDDFAEEQKVWDVWNGSDVANRAAEQWNDYVDGPPTFHRYNILHSY